MEYRIGRIILNGRSLIAAGNKVRPVQDLPRTALRPNAGQKRLDCRPADSGQSWKLASVVEFGTYPTTASSLHTATRSPGRTSNSA